MIQLLLFQVDFYANRYVGTNLSNPSFAEISRTMGGEGIRVTKPEEVGPALTSLIASGKPGVLEIVVSQVYDTRFYFTTNKDKEYTYFKHIRLR